MLLTQSTFDFNLVRYAIRQNKKYNKINNKYWRVRICNCVYVVSFETYKIHIAIFYTATAVSLIMADIANTSSALCYYIACGN